MKVADNPSGGTNRGVASRTVNLRDLHSRPHITVGPREVNRVVHAKETMEKEAHTLTAPSATEAFSEAVVPDTRQPWINTLLFAIPALILPLLVLFQGDFNPAQRDFAVLYSAGQAV